MLLGVLLDELCLREALRALKSRQYWRLNRVMLLILYTTLMALPEIEELSDHAIIASLGRERQNNSWHQPYFATGAN